MSKRFGRQQKRKLKEQLTVEQGLREWYVKKYEQIHHDFETVVTKIEQIQPYSVVTPVKKIAGDPRRYSLYHIPQHHNFMIQYDRNRVPEHCVFDNEKVYRLDVTVDSDAFKSAIHLQLGDDTKVGYFMSESAFNQMNGPPVIWLAEKIAYEMKRHIENGK